VTIDTNLLRKISEDRALGSAVLFAHRHPFASPPAHIEIMDLWRSAEEFVLIEASRQFAKTTLSEEFLVLEGCFGNFHYCLLIGETYTKACERIDAIDYEARTNVKLHQLFGGPVLARKSIENKVFFRTGAIIEAIGWEQELQSFKHHTHRPDRAYLDDPENLERVRDSAAVDASMQKLFLELIPAMDRERRKIRITQTRRADDCMVTRLAANPEWLYRGYPICNGDPDDPATVSNWPQRYTMEAIRRERNSYAAAGMLSSWLQAYMLQTHDPAKKPFKESDLKFIDASPWHWMPRVAIYDPSRTARAKREDGKPASDRTGKVVVSRMGSKLLVHESSGNFWKPSEFIADLFATEKAHRPAKIAIEKNSLDEWLMQPIRIAILQEGIPLPLVALQAPQDRSKEDFIMGLQPFALAGDIVLVGGKPNHAQLVAEWCNYPQGPRDVMNALAYALRMFSGALIYPEFGAAHLTDAPLASRGETVHVGIHGSESETVAVALVQAPQRRLVVAADFVAAGTDAAKSIAYQLRAKFPLAAFQCWAPAELHDQWQRVPTIPKLRAEHVTVYRGEHAAPARGACTTRLRTDVGGGKRLLMVDRNATATLNALSLGYAVPPGRSEPEKGTSRLVGEALECVVAVLDKSIDQAAGMPAGAHVAISPSGQPYMTANPRRN
jgi:hypothetical protein